MASWKQIVDYVENHFEKSSEKNFFKKCTYELSENFIVLSVHVDDNFNICVHIRRIECGISNNMIEINASCPNEIKDYEKLKHALRYLNEKLCSGLVLSENRLDIRGYQCLGEEDSEINEELAIIYFACSQGQLAWEVDQLSKCYLYK